MIRHGFSDASRGGEQSFTEMCYRPFEHPPTMTMLVRDLAVSIELYGLTVDPVVRHSGTYTDKKVARVIDLVGHRTPGIRSSPAFGFRCSDLADSGGSPAGPAGRHAAIGLDHPRRG